MQRATIEPASECVTPDRPLGDTIHGEVGCKQLLEQFHVTSACLGSPIEISAASITKALDIHKHAPSPYT